MAIVAASTQPSPLRARRALWILAVFFLAQLVAGALAGFGFVIYSRASGADHAAWSVGVMPTAIAGTLLGALLAFRSSKRAFRHSPHDLYRTIAWSPASRAAILGSALVGVALCAIYVLVACRLVPPNAEQSLSPFRDAVVNGGWPRHCWALLALVLAPPVEEFLFRGVVFAGLARSWRVPAAGLVTTILFVLSHYYGSLHPYWPAILAITSFAVAALWARIVTKSLVPCISMHVGYNLGMVVAVYAGIP